MKINLPIGLIVLAIIAASTQGFAAIESVPGRIQQTVLRAVVHIASCPDRDGHTYSGTGFIVGRETLKGGVTDTRRYLVTNKHVVGDWNLADADISRFFECVNVVFYKAGAKEDTFEPTVVRINLTDEKGLLRKSKIHLHSIGKVDVVAIDVEGELSAINSRTMAFPLSFFVGFSDFPKFTAGLGDQVFALGYPLGITSMITHLPVAKAGLIVSPPGEPYVVPTKVANRKGVTVDTKFEGKILLVDGLIVGGNSGGPVVLPSEEKIRHEPKTGALQFTTAPTNNAVVGIVSSGLNGSGLSIAYSVDYIKEVIDSF